MNKIVALRPSADTAPHAVNGTTPPNRRRNDALRSRKHLTPDEVERLIQQARKGKHGHRDATMVRMAYVHGLRVSELCGMRWDRVDFKDGTLLVKRLKGSRDSVHYLDGDELRALRKLKRDSKTSFVFESQLGGPISAAGFRKFFARLGVTAGMPWPINPHMLRHACGYALANKGRDTRSLQGYLGHASIAHTVRYTDMSPTRFKGFWTD